MAWIVGVDTGGTFTDIFAANPETGETRCVKWSSTPDDPSRAILTGIEELSRLHGIDLKEVTALAHGTTVGTNALIQRTGGTVAMITTEGFRDLLEIGRQTRPSIFDLQADAPAPLVPRIRRLELSERVRADGAVEKPLDLETLPSLIERMAECGADACAICFLFAFLNPEHEQAVRDRLKELAPDLRVSLSSEVQPEFREFERFNTTAINGYLQPVMEGYIDRLADGLAALAPNATLGINQSSGGLMTAETARAFPVRTALSGPAAGVVGAVHVAKQAGKPNILTVDVGGTSADVALIQDYAPDVAPERDVAGFPIRLPMIDIHTIGAGGGSIAWFDIDGLLKVGPKSAGAVPGPACYSRGGTEPTVSDANLILGRLGEELADGTVRLDKEKAIAAMMPIAEHLGWTVEQAALAVLEIVVSNMVRALRTISVERGHDPAEHALMPFGGAGPLHAREIAAELGITEVLMPAVPGIVCAQGLLVAEAREDFVASRPMVLEPGCEDSVASEITALAGRAQEWLVGVGATAENGRTSLVADARYVGQNFELRVALGETPMGQEPDVPSLKTMKEAFFAEHERAYGYANRNAAVEIVNLRLTGLVKGHDLNEAGLGEADGAPKTRGSRPVWFNGDAPHDTAIYARPDLAAGSVIVGPAIIEQLDTTIPIHPGDEAEVDRYGNILVRIAS